MKANELMIEDWVIFHDSGYASDGTTWEEDRVCQIDSIDEDVRVKWYDESGCKEDWPHISTVLLSPISLTPEILEKNGFEKVLDKDDTECYRYYNSAADGYIKISLYNGGDGDWSIEIVNYEKFDDNEIVYNNNFIFLKVHQLQHALRLCGIEKEIEL